MTTERPLYRDERQRVSKHLVQSVKAACIADLQRHMQRLAEVRQELQCVYADLDVNVLKHAQVIGLTTSGVASKQELVAAIGPKVLSADYMP